MRIALISSEWPGLPTSGGIGTYTWNAAACLARRGHSVEVFTSGDPSTPLPAPAKVAVHCVGEARAPRFADAAGDASLRRHRLEPFDVIEGPEFKSEAAEAARLCPSAAYVVRLHSPSVLLNRQMYLPRSGAEIARDWFQQARSILGLARRRLPLSPFHFENRPMRWFPDTDIDERNNAAQADAVVVMSRAMRRFARDYWWLPEDRIRECPNPFDTPEELLRIEPSTDGKVVGFFGRLEVRKGVLDLADAIPGFVDGCPGWRVVVAGRSTPILPRGQDAEALMKQRLGAAAGRVEFVGPFPPEGLAKFLSGVTVCVVPSRDENFPYAVLEAMAAGRAIVATEVGAVPEILAGGEAGLLVPPGRPSELRQQLIRLARDPELRAALGQAARARLLAEYHPDRVCARMEEIYRAAVDRRKRGPATVGPR